MMLRWAPVGIFLVAFLIRAELLRRQPLADVIGGIETSTGMRFSDECVNIADSLFRRGQFADPFGEPTGPSAHCAPLFPATSALIFEIFGDKLAGGAARKLLNIAGLSAVYAMLPWLGSLLGLGRISGIVAGAFAALFPIFRSSEVFRGRDEWLAAAMVLLLTAFAYRFPRISMPSLGKAIWYGAGWGVLMYIQPTMLTVLPLHLAILWGVNRDLPASERLRLGGAIAAVFVIAVFPWIVRNRVTLGAWAPMRDNLGLELRLSNSDRASAELARAMGSGWYCDVHPICNANSRSEIRQFGEEEFNRREFRQVGEWAVTHKGAMLRLTVERFAYFWADVPSHPWTLLLRVLVSLAALAGVASMWRNGQVHQAALLASIFAAYPLTYYFIQYSSRYVVAIGPALFFTAGYFVFSHFSWMLKKPFALRFWQRMAPPHNCRSIRSMRRWRGAMPRERRFQHPLEDA